MFEPTTRRAVLCALALLGSANLCAQEQFPNKPVRIIIPFAPGGLIDVNTRWVAERMSASLGQPFIIDNRPGGDALIAIRAVKAAPADGYTLLATSSVFSQSLALKQDPGFEAKDFTAIGSTTDTPLVVTGSPSQPDSTLAQILARAKANPETVTFGSGGVGSAAWLSATMMAHMTGVKLSHVPYKGVAAARPDLIAGRLNIVFDTPGEPLPQLVAEGRLRAYAVTSTVRLPDYPNTPTLAELGVTNYVYTTYGGLFAPAGTPREVVARLERALLAVTGSEAFRERCRVDGTLPLPLGSDAFAERARNDTAKVAKMAADMGLPKQ